MGSRFSLVLLTSILLLPIGVGYLMVGRSQPAVAQSVDSRKAEGVSEVLWKANRLLEQGVQQAETNQLESALQSWQQALNMYRRIQNHYGEARVLSELGNAYTTLGQYQQAIWLEQKALTIVRTMHDHNAEARVLGDLGWNFFRLGQYSQATQAFDQIRTIFQTTKDFSGEAQALISLGNIRASRDQYVEAINLHQQALIISRQVKSRKLEAHALMSLGIDYLSAGKYARSIEYNLQAFPILKEVGDHVNGGKALHNIGLNLLAIAAPAEAEKWLIGAVEVWESLRPGLKDENKVSLFETQKSTYNLLQQALIAQNKVGFALEVAERGRARALAELLAKKLQKLESRQLISVLPKVDKIQQIVRVQDATLVQYSVLSGLRRGSQFLYAWVIQPNGKITFRQVDLSSHGSLDDLVIGTRSAMGVGRSPTLIAHAPNVLQFDKISQNQQLQKLHKLLIEPIADLLPTDPNQNIIFIPQGALFSVPFAALQDPNGKYLIEKHTILTAPSGRTHLNFA